MARLGGDEFGLVLPNLANPECAVTVAKKILESLKEPFRLPTESIVVTSSIGVAVFRASRKTRCLCRRRRTSPYIR